MTVSNSKSDKSKRAELKNYLAELQNRTVAAFTAREYSKQNELRDEYLNLVSALVEQEIASARIQQINWFIGTLEHNSQQDTMKLANIQLEALRTKPE